MRVLMVAAEAAPFIKRGGLGDVLGVLPQTLVQKGLECAVVIPRYRSVPLAGARLVHSGLQVVLWHRTFMCDVWASEQGGVTYYLLDQPELFDRDGGIYGFADDHARFAVLSLGAIGVARHLFQPDIIHAHDWHAALAPLYLKSFFPSDPTFARVKTLFTIHNLYDQRIGPQNLGEIGLDPRFYRSDLLEFYGGVSILKAGLVYADRLSTVSPSYAREIQTPEFGQGYEGVLQARSHQLTGILNGVDYSEWNPTTDPHLAANYSADDLSGKAECKAALLKQFDFPVADRINRPLIGVVARLVEQKGWELVRDVFHEFCALDMTFILLGTGDYRYETMFWHMEQYHREKARSHLGYSNGLSHQIEAGADLFLMPSLYEPCGLNQMYSLRYGTLPIVRATGGLDDTIDGETGFKFWGYSGQEMLGAIRYSLGVYRDADRWTRMRITAMNREFSWNHVADEYIALYGQLLNP